HEPAKPDALHPSAPPDATISEALGVQTNNVAEWTGVVEALKLAQGELAPTNEEGDRIGARFVDGKVIMPECFRKAYQTVAAGGYIGASADPELGGMGLPDSVWTAVNEFIMGANVALGLTLILGRGTGHLIETFGTDEMKSLYCEKLYSGQWGGTMCLTEPGAGSDVGASKTRAVKTGEGRYKITGEKIFITSGDHDLAPNIIHAVLARTPDAPPGTKGLSLFIVPKIRIKPDGSLGEPNDVAVGNIEHKLGIHGSPTCAMVFGANDGCEGVILDPATPIAPRPKVSQPATISSVTATVVRWIKRIPFMILVAVFVPIAFVPKLVVEAFTSAEDRNFFSHPGIDPSGMLRAALKDIGKVVMGHRPEGASTITQQVAKNFLLNSQVKFSRKIREAILALRLEIDFQHT
ncbi:MAG: hypothetical protein B7X11_04460, partial [Acidobacteria bacterium 37-65-4]